MSEVEPQAGAPSRPLLGRGLALAILVVVLIGVAGVLYVIVGSGIKPDAGGDLQALAKGPMSKLQTVSDPIRYPPTLFVNEDGKAMRLSSFKGRAVVLNLWATWCAPCVKEMPTLAALQSSYAGKPLAVVAISMDEASQSDAAKAFIAKHAPLKFYQDAKHGFMSDLQPHLQGFPTTVLFDRQGVERAVYAGDTDWSSPEAKAVMDKLIAQ